MEIKSFLQKENIFTKFKSTSKEKFLKEFIRLINSKNPNVNRKDILRKINLKEKIGTSYVGFGISLMYCKTNLNTKKAQIFAALIKDKIEYYDECINVRIVLLVLGDEKDPKDYFYILSTLRNFLKTESNAFSLYNAKSRNEIYKILGQAYRKQTKIDNQIMQIIKYERLLREYNRKQETNYYQNKSKEYNSMIYRMNNLKNKVSRDLLYKFLSLFREKSGKALSRIFNSQCKECNGKIPDYVLEDIQKGDLIIKCNNCGRILYMPARKK